ncbi:MAG: response regulator transcription factor [Nitriliruptorales bacterium]
MLADDADDLRELLRKLLERDGRFAVVAEATNGLEAVDAAGRYQPALLVLDLAMPVMDGLQALPEIRRVAPGTKVLVLSGFAANDAESQALDLGAAGYLEKGGAVRSLADTLFRLLDPDDNGGGPPHEIG